MTTDIMATSTPWEHFLEALQATKKTKPEYLPAYWNGTCLICDDFSSLWAEVVDENDDLVQHPLADSLNLKPNKYQTPYDFRFAGLLSAIDHGNAYYEIDESLDYHYRSPQEVRIKKVRGRIPLPPQYEILRDGKWTDIDSDKIIHVKGPTRNGITGIGVLDAGSSSLEEICRMERFASALWKNGARPSGTLESPVGLSDKTRDTLQEGFKRLNQGEDNAGSVPVLEEGVKFNQMSMNPVDAQFLESRTFALGTVARLLKCPVQYLQDHTKSTGYNLSEISRIYAQQCQRPWCERFAQAFGLKVLEPGLRLRFRLESLIRGDVAGQAAACAQMAASGCVTGNELREMYLDLGPRPELNSVLSPLNIANGDTGNTNINSPAVSGGEQA